jgi:hypothetical protein
MAVPVKSHISWDVIDVSEELTQCSMAEVYRSLEELTQCSMAEDYRRFGGTDAV